MSALIEQSRTVHGWLVELQDDAFHRATVLNGWDVRTLVGHLVLVVDGFTRVLQRPTTAKPVPVHDLVQRYRRDEEEISRATRDFAGEATGAELVARLATGIDALEHSLSGQARLPATLNTPRGPGSTAEFAKTRIVEVVVHCDDLSRSLPERAPIPLRRAALSSCTRSLTAILAAQQPGRSLEVRVPPFAAVQCGIGDPGPTHTRGTPPNVVETDPLTFLRLATGRLSWAEARESGQVSASGLRADLSAALPLLS